MSDDRISPICGVPNHHDDFHVRQSHFQPIRRQRRCQIPRTQRRRHKLRDRNNGDVKGRPRPRDAGMAWHGKVSTQGGEQKKVSSVLREPGSSVLRELGFTARLRPKQIHTTSAQENRKQVKTKTRRAHPTSVNRELRTECVFRPSQHLLSFLTRVKKKTTYDPQTSPKTGGIRPEHCSRHQNRGSTPLLHPRGNGDHNHHAVERTSPRGVVTHVGRVAPLSPAFGHRVRPRNLLQQTPQHAGGQIRL